MSLSQSQSISLLHVVGLKLTVCFCYVQPGVIYLGRIPHGFYEDEMRSYFEQFGEVTRLRLSRNRTVSDHSFLAFNLALC